MIGACKGTSLNQFVKAKGFLEVGTRSLAALPTFRFDTRLIFKLTGLSKFTRKGCIGGIKLRAWLNGNAMFCGTFICFYVSETKPLCFSLCSQMFDDVERC